MGSLKGKEVFMKKIIKAGMYLSLAAMLALGTGTVVLAYKDEDEINSWEDEEGTTTDYTWSQWV